MFTGNWMVLAIFICAATLSIYLEKTKIGSRLGSAVIALFIGMLLTNLKIIPEWTDIHDVVMSYLIYLAIPLMLFKADFRRIFKVGHKLLGAFALGTIGTLLGAFVAAFIFNIGPETYKAYGMFAATYIGGSANLAAVGSGLETSPTIWTAVNAADVVAYFIYFVFLMNVGYMAFFRKRFVSYKDIDNRLDELQGDDGDNSINLRNMAIVLAAAVACAAIGEWIGDVIGFPGVLFSTTLALILSATTKLPSISDIGEKMGNYLMTLFLVVIGATTVLSELLVAGPTVFLGALTVLCIHCLVVFIGGKIFHLPIEYLIIASSANIGGPTTAAPTATAYKWDDLVLPAVLLGLLGYILGTYFGYGAAYLMQMIL